MTLRIGWISYMGEDPKGCLDRAKRLGFDNIQAGCPTLDWDTEAKRPELKQMIADSGIDITAMFIGFKTEDYSSIARIHATGGFLMQEERKERREFAARIVDLAAYLELPGVAAHLGFIPDDEGDPDYAYLAGVVGEIANRCDNNGLKFSFETGQEKATTLKHFIDDVPAENIGVNFDPANMILYGSGEPMEAIEILGPYVLGVHAKDGKWAAPDVRGVEWGTETALGEGDVDFPKLIERLKFYGYKGAITIEREIEGDQQETDLVTAREMLEKLL